MDNLLQKIENKQIAKLVSKKNIPAFRPGDTLKVTIKIIEGDRSRSQAFEGVCIARKNNSVNSKFTVRKISHGEGVERVFPLFSPVIEKIEVVRKGDVRRAKLYYLRNRTGKSARISDLDRGEEADQYTMTSEPDISSDQKTDNTDNINDEEKSNIESSNEDAEATSKNNDLKNEEDKTQANMSESVSNKESSLEEKSESTASEADKTKDESKK